MATLAPHQLTGSAGRRHVIGALARHYRDRLLAEANLEQLTTLPRPSLKARIESLVGQMIRQEGRLISYEDRVALISTIIDETVGYGPLETLFGDPSITEIMVNGPKKVYVERAGMADLQLDPEVEFLDDRHVLHIIDRIVSPLGKRIDESSPMVDARLPDGSRVNAVIAPVALDGPTMTIRRFRETPFKAEDLIRFQSQTPEMIEFLAACVRAKLNILVSGGTGSGKTTLLNVLSGFIPPKERIVTIEDAAELRFYEQHPHVVRMEARPPNIEGQGEIAIRQLVRNALRMRPNRIVVGEVRGPEALDMLQAMNTGHEGSLTTIHANTVRDAFSRLETMVLMAGLEGLPLGAIREQIIGALDLVVQQNRLIDNSRKVVTVAEVMGVGEEGDVRLETVFEFVQTGVTHDGKVSGHFQATGYRPRAMERLRAYGIPFDEGAFDPGRRTGVGEGDSG